MIETLHEFAWRTMEQREWCPERQNQCWTCNGWPADPQHGGQYSDDARQYSVDGWRVTQSFCGWCEWKGPRHKGWGNRQVSLASSDWRKHQSQTHPNGPPASLPFAGRMPGWSAHT